MSDDRPRVGEIVRSATLSGDHVYRYTLTRIWEPSHPIIVWVGLNPSTADAYADDPTIRREISFSRHWGYGGMIKVNLFALRATQPSRLTQAISNGIDPIGPLNETMLWSETSERVTVAAWGGSAPRSQQDRVRTLGWRLREERDVYVLGFTKDGWPRHPLYVPGSTDLTAWSNTHPLPTKLT